MKENRRARIVFIIFIMIIIIALGIFLYKNLPVGSIDKETIIKATMSDIDGNWTQTLFSNTYTFIPSKNINGLILQFDIYDSNNKLQNTITKSIGNVKKGQQYTVTLTLDEYWTGSKVATSVKQGTISLF